MPSKACLRLTVPPLPSRYLNSICSSPLPKRTRSLISLRQALERRLDVELRVPREGLNQLEVVGIAPIPAAYRAAGERQMRIGDDLLGIEEFLRAEAVAARTGADRAVEGEQPRLELRQRVIADRACELGGEHELGARGSSMYATVPARADAQRGLEGFGRRWLRSGRTRNRSTMTSTVCLRLTSSLGARSSSTTSPSMRARTNPPACSSSMSSACSPLRSEIAGASSISAVSSGCSSTASTIWLMVCAARSM